LTPNRSDALTLAVILFCYGAYFWFALEAPTDPGSLLGGVLGLYVGFTVLITVAQICVQLLSQRLAHAADPAARAREARIGAAGARNSYWTVMLTLWTVPPILAVGGELIGLYAVVAVMGLAETVRFTSRMALRGFGPRGGQNHAYLAG